MWTASRLPDAIDAGRREAGKSHELAFWAGFMQSERFRLCWCDLTPNPECDRDIYTVLRALAACYAAQGRTIDVLDIGSGPASILGTIFHGLPANLRAADPLADDYERLWTDSARHAKAVRPVAVAGEDLAGHFGTQVFDVAHIRNAIDHAVHPMAVVEQMLAITRPGGFLIIHGFENEAIAEHWHGFHQWNMRVDRDDLEFEGATHQKYRVMASFSQQLRLISAYTAVLVDTKRWSTLIAAVA